MALAYCLWVPHLCASSIVLSPFLVWVAFFLFLCHQPTASFSSVLSFQVWVKCDEDESAFFRFRLMTEKEEEKSKDGLRLRRQERESSTPTSKRIWKGQRKFKCRRNPSGINQPQSSLDVGSRWQNSNLGWLSGYGGRNTKVAQGEPPH